MKSLTFNKLKPLHATDFPLRIMLHVTDWVATTMGTPTNDRVRKYRESLRLAGLRPVQLWVPDTRRPDFAETCRAQSAKLVNDAQEHEILAWAASAGDQVGWK